MKFDGWRCKTIGHLLDATSSFVHHFVTISQIKLELQSGTPQFWSKSDIFYPVWPWNLTMILKNNRAHLLCYFKLCASFHNHRLIQTRVTVWKHPIWVKISNFFFSCDLEIWWMTLKNNRTSFLCHIKLCQLLLWSYGPEIPKLGQFFFYFCHPDLWSVTLTLTWSSLLSMVNIPDNLMTIQWEEHCKTRQIWGIW